MELCTSSLSTCLANYSVVIIIPKVWREITGYSTKCLKYFCDHPPVKVWNQLVPIVSGEEKKQEIYASQRAQTATLRGRRLKIQTTDLMNSYSIKTFTGRNLHHHPNKQQWKPKGSMPGFTEYFFSQNAT